MADIGADLVLAVQVGVEVEDWKGAVRAACQPLVEAGAVRPGYSESCIALAEAHGPYMVLAPGIALAHARPEDGVQRLCLALAMAEPPVIFHHPENDPVDLVFAFGSPDSEQHVGLLAALARALIGGLAGELRATRDPAAVRRRLSEVVEDVR